MLTNDSLWQKAPTGFLFSGIGSLPHPYIDAAIQFSFSHSIPFLPQLPARNPQEFMVNQALDLMPGLTSRSGGLVEIDAAVWTKQSQRLGTYLEKAFSATNAHWAAFDRFEPSPGVWSCWTPFLWELEERRTPFAKIQIAGPMTCQWALRLADGGFADRDVLVGTQVFRLILARAIAMCRRLRAIGVVPLLILDEPGFYGFSSSNPRQKLALEELRIFLIALKKEEVLLGIHCCSNTEWTSLLGLPIDILSLDVNLSLPFLLNQTQAVESFLARGGRLALGIVPTGSHALKLRSFEPRLLWRDMASLVSAAFGNNPVLSRRLLTEALYTPACGLALHSVQDAEAILSHLVEIGGFVSALP